MPSSVSHLLIQSMAGSLGGFTTTIITNPLDIIRARLQVNNNGKHSKCIAIKLRFFLGSKIRFDAKCVH